MVVVVVVVVVVVFVSWLLWLLYELGPAAEESGIEGKASVLELMSREPGREEAIARARASDRDQKPSQTQHRWPRGS